MQLELHGPVTSQGAGSEWCKLARTAISVSEWESEAEGLEPRTIELWIKMKRLELMWVFPNSWLNHYSSLLSFSFHFYVKTQT